MSCYPPEFRLRVLQEVIRQQTPVEEVSRIYGIGRTTIHNWLSAFDEGGEAALKPQTSGPRKRAPSDEDARRELVVRMKQNSPELGTRRIVDVLQRFEGLGVSETTVRRILHEEGLLESRPPELEKAPRPETRFERAEPNQLWQSDIFTFLLRRHERLYVTVFMDDCSRFVVGHAIAHRQQSALVMEAFERAVANFGVPREVLTDNGRQYTTWRGQTEFEAELKRQNIHHIKSRPHHPQTLGKVERFWKTLWDEFLSRTVFADFDDCVRRLALFIDGYNFRRPHQGIEGLVPADRYFRAAPQVRAAMEAAVQENATRLALQQPVRKPFYLAGRLGDQTLSIAARGGKLRVQMGDEQPHTIHLPKEEADEVSASARVDSNQDTFEAAAPPAPDAEVAEGPRGGWPGGGGAAPLPARAVGAERGAAGDGRDRDDRGVEAAVLPARGGCAEGDDARAAALGRGARGGGDIARWPGAVAAGPGDATRDGEAARGAAALLDEEAGEAWPGEGGQRREETPRLGGRWAERLEACTADEGRAAAAPARHLGDDIWRDDAVKWVRKLAGAEAPGGIDGGESVREDTGAFGEPAAPVRGGAAGALGRNDSHRRGGELGLEPGALPDADESWPAWLAGSARRAAAWAQADAGNGADAQGASSPTAAGERGAPAAGGGVSADDADRRRVDAQGTAERGPALQGETNGGGRRE